MLRRVVFVLSILAVSAVDLAGQQPPVSAVGLVGQQPPVSPVGLAGQQTPVSPDVAGTLPAGQDSGGPVTTLHVTARLVVFDVVVTDGKGGPVKGLTAADFKVTEDGAPQSLFSLTEHDATVTLVPLERGFAAALPRNTFAVRAPELGNGAVTVVVLDHISVFDAPYVRDQVKEFLQTSAPSMPVAFLRLDWQGMHLVQGLTAERKVLLEAATSKRMLPPLGFPVRYPKVVGSPMGYLAKYLAGVPGRINLVWFGEGSAPGGHNGLFADTAGGISPALAAFMRSQAGEAPNVHRLSRVALFPIDAGGLRAESAFVAPNSHLQDLSPGWQPGDESDAIESMASCQALMEAAIAAGGEGFCNTNGFKEALAKVDALGSHFYTLSYRPTNPIWDGSFRRIKVEVGSLAQEGSAFDRLVDWMNVLVSPKLLYRDGYYARNVPSAPQEVKSAPIDPTPSSSGASERRLISVSMKGSPGHGGTQMESAMAFGTLTPVQIHFTVAVSPLPQVEKNKASDPLPPGNFLNEAFRGTAYRICRIHYRIEPEELNFVRTASGAYRDDLQFVAMLYRDDGLIANSIATTGSIEVAAKDIDRAREAGISSEQTIAVPTAGNFFLRAGVHEVATGHIGALEVPGEWIEWLPADAGSAAK